MFVRTSNSLSDDCVYVGIPSFSKVFLKIFVTYEIILIEIYLSRESPWNVTTERCFKLKKAQDDKACWTPTYRTEKCIRHLQNQVSKDNDTILLYIYFYYNILNWAPTLVRSHFIKFTYNGEYLNHQHIIKQLKVFNYLHKQISWKW